MFRFFGSKRDSLLACATKNNDSCLDAAETRSSEDSYSRHYNHHDDESSLESYSDIIGQDIVWEDARGCEPGIEASLSSFEMEIQSSNAQEPQIKELHRLVNIMSEEEKSEVPAQDMPAYKIRRRIATKVMAKKVSKGYLLLEESCKLCDMPLMEGRGKKECKVCPAIKKWINKHTPNAIDDREPAATTETLRDLCDEAEKYCNDSKERQLEDDDQTINDEISNQTPSIAQYMTPDIRARIYALSPIPEALEISNTNTSANLENKAHESCETGNADQRNTIEDRATQIIMEARNKQGWIDSSPRSDVIRDAEYTPANLENKAHESYEAGNIDQRKTIEDRATQIIMEARNKEGWVDSSPRSGVIHDAEYYQEVAEARAELIIQKARESLRKDAFLGGSSPLTPMSKLRNEHRAWLSFTACKMRSWDAAVIIQSFARMVPVRMSYLEHQSEKRTLLYRELLGGKFNTGDDEDAKFDAIFEARSEENIGDKYAISYEEDVKRGQADPEGDADNDDPEGEVLHSVSAAVEHAESHHADVEDEASKQTFGNGFFAEQGMEILSIDDKGGSATPKAVTSEVNSIDSNREPDGRLSEGMYHKSQNNHKTKSDPATFPDAVSANDADAAPNTSALPTIQEANSSSSGGKTTVESGPVESMHQTPHPGNRNVFAKVACSFDDAVLKAVSNVKDLVKCTGGDVQLEEAIGMGMGHYKSVSIAEPSSDGTYFDEKRKAASYRIMYRTSLGWGIANSSCALCQMPMMQRPDDQEVLCIICDEVDATDNATLASSTLPLKDTNHQASRPMSSVAIPDRKPIEPDDDSVCQTSVLTQTTVRGKPIDPEPLDKLEPPSNIKPTKTPSYKSGSDALSSVNAQVKHKNKHAYPRWVASNSEPRQAGTYLNLQQQWGCPQCGMQMARRAHDNSDHCRSCGMIVYPVQTNFVAGPVPTYNPSPIISLLDADINAGINTGDMNPFSRAHRMMISSPRSMALSHHGMRANPSQHQSYGHPAFAPQIVAPHGLTQHVPPFAQNHHPDRPMQRGHRQSRSMNSNDTPAPDHRLESNAPTPNVHRLKRNDLQHIYGNLEVKENTYGQANLGHMEVPLTAVEEAKLRMQNAQNALRRTNPH